ncbi:MAG TPA: 2OG-Fe(II) oxygenase [Acidimicrobiales bacterium]|nr:2OG-Fe(II) oxygenase [Acidimicrobiales bacterium]
MSDDGIRIQRPLPGLLVADGLFAGVADEFRAAVEAVPLEIQRVGLARVDGLPERRSRGTTTEPSIPALLWPLLEPVLPPLPEWFDAGETPQLDPPVTSWRAVGCNPMTRVYRYSLGERFAPHVDRPWRPTPARRSFLTVLVYLPSGAPCLGGETVVYGTAVTCTDWRCVTFDHRLLHEGRPIEKGEKLVVRSDVVYEAGL